LLQVAVAAYSGEPTASLAEAARSFVSELAESCREAVLILGGYRGLMRVVADAAIAHGLRVVFVVPPAYEGDSYPRGSVVIRTGLGPRERSSVLVRSGDVVAVLGGGVGTLFEALLACSYGIPVYYLRMAGEESLLTERFAGCLPDGVVDARLGCRLRYFPEPHLMARALCREAGVGRV